MGFVGRRLWRTSITRGVLGGNQTWLAIAVVLGVRKLVRRLAGDEAEVLYCEELGPGDRLLISPVDES